MPQIYQSEFALGCRSQKCIELFRIYQQSWMCSLPSFSELDRSVSFHANNTNWKRLIHSVLSLLNQHSWLTKKNSLCVSMCRDHRQGKKLNYIHISPCRRFTNSPKKTRLSPLVATLRFQFLRNLKSNRINTPWLEHIVVLLLLLLVNVFIHAQKFQYHQQLHFTQFVEVVSSQPTWHQLPGVVAHRQTNRRKSL